MVMVYTVNEFGEPVRVNSSTAAAPSQQAPKQADKQADKPANKTKDNHYMLGMKLASVWGQQIVPFAGDFWTFNPETGWITCTKKIHAAANKLAGTSAERTIIPILNAQLALPDNCGSTTFWERTGDFWNPAWKPYKPTQMEVLFSDGIYNLMTDEFVAYKDRCIFGPFLTTKWVTEDFEEPVCYEFNELVEAQFPDLNERNHLQEVLSTILQPHIPLRGQIVLYGVPYSRKTTLATAVACAPAGRYGMSQVQEATLVRDKFATHALVNKLANVSDDSPRTQKWVGFVKQYTSGNMVVEPKFHQPVSVTPTAKLISTCNEIQSLIDSSGAATDRLYLFELKHSFEKIHGSADSVRMTAEYWSETGRRAGVVAWLIAGLRRLRIRGRFDPPTSWTDNLNRAKVEADEIASQLLDNFVAGDAEDFVSTAELLEAVKLPKNTPESRLMAKYVARLFPSTTPHRNKKVANEPRGYLRLRKAT